MPLLIFVEGGNDIAFLTRISRVLHSVDQGAPDLAQLERAGRIVFVPFGGSDLFSWLGRLRPLGCPEFHLYDREIEPITSHRRRAADIVNTMPNCRAIVTGKRSLENYLHPDAIYEVSQIQIVFDDESDVAAMVAEQTFISRHGSDTWAMLTTRSRARLKNLAKRWLNRAAVERMTEQRLDQRDPERRLRASLDLIAEMAHENQIL